MRLWPEAGAGVAAVLCVVGFESAESSDAGSPVAFGGSGLRRGARADGQDLVCNRGHGGIRSRGKGAAGASPSIHPSMPHPPNLAGHLSHKSALVLLPPPPLHPPVQRLGRTHDRNHRRVLGRRLAGCLCCGGGASRGGPRSWGRWRWVAGEFRAVPAQVGCRAALRAVRSLWSGVEEMSATSRWH